MKPWCRREVLAVAEVCWVLCYPSGFLSFGCSSHHPRGFCLPSLLSEVLALAALWMLPTPGKSHQLFLLPQALQMQRGLVPEPCHAGCSFLP